MRLLLLAAVITITCGWLRIVIETREPIPAWQHKHSETMEMLDRRREKARREALEPYPADYDYSGVIAG